MNTKIFNSMSLLGREEAYLASPRVWSFVPTCSVGVAVAVCQVRI